MQCTSCNKILDLSNFSYKNITKKIYYLHCDHCRENIKKANPEKKEKEKRQYERVKKNSLIRCKCGAEYVAFREYHILRHLNSKRHIAANI
jgi:hypothetical protein